MAKLYISEFRQGVSGIGTTWAQMLPQPPIAEQVVDIGDASAQCAPFNSFTRAVRLNTDTACSIVFGDDPVATVDNARMSADETEVFAVEAGQKLAVIANT